MTPLIQKKVALRPPFLQVEDNNKKLLSILTDAYELCLHLDCQLLVFSQAYDVSKLFATRPSAAKFIISGFASINFTS